MGEKRDRDVEKVYSTSEFVAKLRRLADALEASGSRSRWPGRVSTCRPERSSTSNTSGKGARKRSSSSSSGPTAELLHFHADYPASWRALLELSVRPFLFLPLFT
jgi:hypothetical protein